MIRRVPDIDPLADRKWNSRILSGSILMSFADPSGEEPDAHGIIFRLGVAVRRLLLIVDGRRAEAKDAAEVVREADRFLVTKAPPKKSKGSAK